jgi:hypothetical protein
MGWRVVRMGLPRLAFPGLLVAQKGIPARPVDKQSAVLWESHAMQPSERSPGTLSRYQKVAKCNLLRSPPPPMPNWAYPNAGGTRLKSAAEARSDYSTEIRAEVVSIDTARPLELSRDFCSHLDFAGKPGLDLAGNPARLPVNSLLSRGNGGAQTLGKRPPSATAARAFNSCRPTRLPERYSRRAARGEATRGEGC